VYTLPEYLQIAWKWSASFLRRNWRLEHYPVRVRRNETAESSQAWFAQILHWPGPVGIGPTPAAARLDLAAVLETIRRERAAMPRPGSRVPVEFASSDRLDTDPELYEHFREHVLGFEWVLMTDGTALSDFGDEARVTALVARVKEVYGVDVSDISPPLVADIFDRIRSASPSWRSPGS